MSRNFNEKNCSSLAYIMSSVKTMRLYLDKIVGGIFILSGWTWVGFVQGDFPFLNWMQGPNIFSTATTSASAAEQFYGLLRCGISLYCL